MKQEGAGRLLDAVGEIDDDLIEETARFRQRSSAQQMTLRNHGKTTNRRKTVTMLVTLSAAALTGMIVFRFTGGFSRPSEVASGTAPAAAEEAPALYGADAAGDAAMKKSADKAQEPAAASTGAYDGALESAAALQSYEIRSAEDQNEMRPAYLVASSFEGTVSSGKDNSAQDSAVAGAAAPDTVTFHVSGLLLPNGHTGSYEVRVTAGSGEAGQTADATAAAQEERTYDFSAGEKTYQARIAAPSLTDKAESFTVTAGSDALKDIVIYVQDISETDENGKKQDNSITYQDILSDGAFWDTLSITKAE